MKEIICSSKLLHETLKEFLINIHTYERQELFNIYTEGKVLWIDNYRMDIEPKEAFDFKYRYDTLKALKKVLKKMPEQPITITFTLEQIIINNIHI